MTIANRCPLYLFKSLCQCCLSSTVNATTSCDLTFGCRWEQSHKKWKRLMKKRSCVYLSDLWPAPKADIIPQCALIGWQQHLERHSRFSPGLVAKSHESIQRRLEGRETITHEEVLFTSHRCMMTEAVVSTQDTVFHFYLIFHSLIKKKKKRTCNVCTDTLKNVWRLKEKVAAWEEAMVILVTCSNTSWCLEITGPWNRDFITPRSKIWSPIATPMRRLG